VYSHCYKMDSTLQPTTKCWGWTIIAQMYNIVGEEWWLDGRKDQRTKLQCKYINFSVFQLIHTGTRQAPLCDQTKCWDQHLVHFSDSMTLILLHSCFEDLNTCLVGLKGNHCKVYQLPVHQVDLNCLLCRRSYSQNYIFIIN